VWGSGPGGGASGCGGGGLGATFYLIYLFVIRFTVWLSAQRCIVWVLFFSDQPVEVCVSLFFDFLSFYLVFVCCDSVVLDFQRSIPLTFR